MNDDVQAQINRLDGRLQVLDTAVKGNEPMGIQGLSQQVQQAKSELAKVKKTQQEWIWEEEREKEREAKRAKIRNFAITFILGTLGSTLAGIFVLLFKILNQGVSP